MGYSNLQECVADLANAGQLVRIDHPIDPRLEMALIQRRAFEAKAPALLFTHPKDCGFPMLANLFGTKERVNFIFRDTLDTVKTIFSARANPARFLKSIWRKAPQWPRLLCGLSQMRHRYVSCTPVLAKTCKLQELPKLVSWPEDGGPFITLPLVLTEDPDAPGAFNLGMYRIQLNGNAYADNEVGMHYQLQRGIGIHHSHALSKGFELPVNVHVGGPPALTVAAIMPLPEGMNELIFAGLLGGRRMKLTKTDALPVLSECDFVLKGVITKDLKPEGPFGDHLGYYSLAHDFPVMRVKSVHHRENAIWPFTSVGRPPQEDTMFGDLIHELTSPMVGNVFEGAWEIHAVDAAGVHPLLLALGSERYTAYEASRRPRELLTLAMHLLGTTQTALAKFVLLAAREDAPGLRCRDVPGFFRHILERTDFRHDLHFFTECACDTLDYTGYALHEGSRLIWAVAGEKKRELGTEVKNLPRLPNNINNPCLVMPGIIALNGPKAGLGRHEHDPLMEELAYCFENFDDSFPLIAVVDDSRFTAASVANFLWTVFTRTDPARDSYGPLPRIQAKHWSCSGPLILDARLKPFQAKPLEDDPAVVAKVNELASGNGPLAGLF